MMSMTAEVVRARARQAQHEAAQHRLRKVAIRANRARRAEQKAQRAFDRAVAQLQRLTQSHDLEQADATALLLARA